MKKALILLFSAALLFITGCEKLTTEELPPLPVMTEPAPIMVIDDSPADTVAAPAPSETPEAKEPEYEAGPAVTVNGTELASGSFMADGAAYVSFEELAEALGAEYQQPDMNNPWSFIYQGSACTLTAFESTVSKNAETFELSSRVLWHHDEAYVGAEALCGLLGIPLYTDEDGKMYFTPAAGDWSIAEGYNVPVLVYHEVSDDIWGTEKYFVSPRQLEEQLAWLLEQGYQPMWFSDLAHVESYQKPIILTFDDGYTEDCTTVLPLLQKYKMKATVFVTTGYSLEGAEHYLTPGQIMELSQSPLVEIQSSTRSHEALTSLTAAELERELKQSKEDIVKLTGKEPYVIAYPNGTRTKDTDKIVKQFYRFGLVAEGRIYVTGSSETSINRLSVLRGSSVEQLKALLY